MVVEDETLLSMMIEDILCDLGWEVPANVASVSEALLALDRGGFDIALLDVNVAGKDVFPVAEALVGRNIPFVFTTGYGMQGIRIDLQHHPALQKPFTASQLIAAIRDAMDRHDRLQPATGAAAAAVAGPREGA